MALHIGTRTVHAVAFGEVMNPYFREGGPIRVGRAEAIRHLGEFRRTVLDRPSVDPSGRAVRADSNSWRPGVRTAVAQRLRGIEVQARLDDTALAPAIGGAPTAVEIAAQRFVGRAAILDFYGDADEMCEAHGDTTYTALPIWSSVFSALLGYALYAGIADANVRPLMASVFVAGLFNPFALVHTRTHARYRNAAVAALDAMQQNRMQWAFQGSNIVATKIGLAGVGRSPAADGVELSALRNCLPDMLGFGFKRLLFRLSPATWLGLDRPLSRDPVTGEPVLTVVVRKAAHAPQFPKAVSARHGSGVLVPAQQGR